MVELPMSGIMVAGEILANKPWVKRINHQKRYFPTAVANDSKSHANATIKNKQTTKQHDGRTLTDFVRMFPTPTVQDSENDGGDAQFRRNSLPLNAVVKLWPTPKSTYSGPDFARANRPKSGTDDLVTAVARVNPDGQLSPDWVEWLMGFEKGWTK